MILHELYSIQVIGNSAHTKKPSHVIIYSSSVPRWSWNSHDCFSSTLWLSPSYPIHRWHPGRCWPSRFSLSTFCTGLPCATIGQGTVAVYLQMLRFLSSRSTASQLRQRSGPLSLWVKVKVETSSRRMYTRTLHTAFDQFNIVKEWSFNCLFHCSLNVERSQSATQPCL